MLTAAAIFLSIPVHAQDLGGFEPDEPIVLPPGLFLTNATAGPIKRSPAVEQAILHGDADRVRSAGGTPMDVIAALRRGLSHNPPVMAQLRKFADTTDGARVTFGYFQGSNALMRRARDGKVTYVSLDNAFADLMALE